MSGGKTESRREEYRKYLEKGGVLDAITKVMVALYEEPEKPNDALEFLRQHLGNGGMDAADIESMKSEIVDLRQSCEALQSENAELSGKIQQLEQAAKGESAAE